MKLKILVGTMTSTADYVAQAIQMDCADLVSDIDVELMDNLDISVFDAAQAEDALYLICSSTYGSGDVPDNARALYESLGNNPQFLGHVPARGREQGKQGDRRGGQGARRLRRRLQNGITYCCGGMGGLQTSHFFD